MRIIEVRPSKHSGSEVNSDELMNQVQKFLKEIRHHRGLEDRVEEVEGRSLCQWCKLNELEAGGMLTGTQLTRWAHIKAEYEPELKQLFAKVL